MIKQLSRRAFLEGSAFATVTLLGACGSRVARALEQEAAPELLVINGRITTLDEARPRAQAFAVRGGRFMAIGNTDEIKALAGRGTQVIDAAGMTITPGFIDTHNHLRGDGVLFGVLAGNPFAVEYVTLQSIVARIRERAAMLPPNTWIVANFYDDTKIKDKRPLTRADLDQATTQHPVKVNLRGGHAAVYNSKAFQLAGITRDTPDPYGGTYEKDARGELSGRVTDNAERVLDKFGDYEKFDAAETERRAVAGMEFITKKFAEFGITSVCYDGTGGASFDAVQTVRQRGNLLTRINYEPNSDGVEAMIKAGIKTGFGDEWVRLGGTWERVQDGGMSSRTMAMTQPYIGISPPYKGNLTEPQESLNEWAEHVHRAGIRLNTHCNGEPAIERALVAYERALRLLPVADARPKFTHCSLPSAAQIARIKALNGQPSLFNTYLYYNSDKFRYYGAQLAEHMLPYKDFAAAGVNVTTGSDFYPGPFDPRMGIQGMVTRTGFNGETWGASQKLTVDEALRISTVNGAYHTFEESIKGSITVGKLADFVILAEDLYNIDPHKIKDVKIARTVVGGRTMYQG